MIKKNVGSTHNLLLCDYLYIFIFFLIQFIHVFLIKKFYIERNIAKDQ